MVINPVDRIQTLYPARSGTRSRSAAPLLKTRLFHRSLATLIVFPFGLPLQIINWDRTYWALEFVLYFPG